MDLDRLAARSRARCAASRSPSRGSARGGSDAASARMRAICSCRSGRGRAARRPPRRPRCCSRRRRRPRLADGSAAASRELERLAPRARCRPRRRPRTTRPPRPRPRRARLALGPRLRESSWTAAARGAARRQRRLDGRRCIDPCASCFTPSSFGASLSSLREELVEEIRLAGVARDARHLLLDFDRLGGLPDLR